MLDDSRTEPFTTPCGLKSRKEKRSALLTDEELRTLLSEAARIVNSSPLWTPCDDAKEPSPLAPDNLITLRDAELPLDRKTSKSDPAAYGKQRWKRKQ